MLYAALHEFLYVQETSSKTRACWIAMEYDELRWLAWRGLVPSSIPSASYPKKVFSGRRQ